MITTPALRNLALTAHVAFSVGLARRGGRFSGAQHRRTDQPGCCNRAWLLSFDEPHRPIYYCPAESRGTYQRTRPVTGHPVRLVQALFGFGEICADYRCNVSVDTAPVHGGGKGGAT